MTRRSVYFVLASMVCVAITCFLVRQRTLGEIRSGNESLRQQMETPGNGARSETGTEVPSTNSVTALSAEEKTELLRLRGQVPSLRSDAANASNRVASLASPRATATGSARSASPEPPNGRDAILEFMHSEPYQNANVLARAVNEYMRLHGGQIPEDLAAVPAPGNYSFATDGTLQRFELVRTGNIAGHLELAPYLLIAHEKEPIQLPDGKWVRLYIQANGGVTIAGPVPNKPPLDDSDFIRQQEEMGKRKVQPK